MTRPDISHVSADHATFCQRCIEGLEGKIEMVSEGVSANYEAHQRLRVEMDRRFDDVDSFLRLPLDATARRHGSTDSN